MVMKKLRKLLMLALIMGLAIAFSQPVLAEDKPHWWESLNKDSKKAGKEAEKNKKEAEKNVKKTKKGAKKIVKKHVVKKRYHKKVNKGAKKQKNAPAKTQ